MAKKNRNLSEAPMAEKTDAAADQRFYFNRENYKWMLIGLALIMVGFLLMMGPDANTVDGKYDPNLWNEGIFSFRRIRLAPLLVIAGFGVQVYAILKRTR